MNFLVDLFIDNFNFLEGPVLNYDNFLRALHLEHNSIQKILIFKLLHFLNRVKPVEKYDSIVKNYDFA